MTTRAYYNRGSGHTPLITAKSHVAQCDGNCEIAQDDVVNMEGLPLSLLGDGGEKSVNGTVKDKEDRSGVSLIDSWIEAWDDDSDTDSEDSGRERSDNGHIDLRIMKKLLQEPLPVEESDESDIDCSDLEELIEANDPIFDRSERRNQSQEKEPTSTIKIFSGAIRVPTVIPAEDNNDGSDVDRDFDSQEEGSGNGNDRAASTSSISSAESTNSNNKRPNNDQLENRFKKKGRVSNCNQQ